MPKVTFPPIVLATEADAPAIAEMSRDYIEHGLAWGYRPARIQRYIRDPASNVVVMRCAGMIQAFAIMTYGTDDAHLVLMGVQPGRRRRRVGTHLLRWLESCAEVAGIGTIRVEARVDNHAALRFYRHHGYVAGPRIPGYYQGLLDAVRLEKRLLPEIDEPARSDDSAA